MILADLGDRATEGDGLLGGNSAGRLAHFRFAHANLIGGEIGIVKFSANIDDGVVAALGDVGEDLADAFGGLAERTLRERDASGVETKSGEERGYALLVGWDG